MEFDKIIDGIILDIENLNNTIKQTDLTQLPLTISKPTINKNVAIRDQYTMETIQRKQNYINYKRDIRKNPDGNVENYNVIETENLINTISSLDYNKTWSRLDKYQKKVKLIQYIHSLEHSNNLTKQTKETLLAELLDLIINKKIKSNDINYDIKTQRLMSIKQLNFKEGSYIINT